MNILIPMAGEGKRFRDVGYDVSKPAIKTYERKSGKLLPMVVCATLDLPGVKNDGSNVIYIERDFHKKDGTENEIKSILNNSRFITVDHLTEGQACTCLLAEKLINNTDELLIAGCDNGMDFDKDKFENAKQESDVLVFTYRHNETVLQNPNAYGFMKTYDNSTKIESISIKKAISNNPMEDHAVVATFWFKEGKIFVDMAKKMIAENDRINNEFYVDEVIKYVINAGFKANVFEIDRYICLGTPIDYENYQKTYEYWKGFYEREKKFING